MAIPLDTLGSHFLLPFTYEARKEKRFLSCFLHSTNEHHFARDCHRTIIDLMW